jgi:hypothetical protein
MRNVATVALAAVFAMAAWASAKTVTTQAKTANEQSVNAVAGPPPAKNAVAANERSSPHPSKKALRKSKVTPPPPMHDPN